VGNDDGRGRVRRQRAFSRRAVCFSILVGELMASSNVTERLVSSAQALVGHIRGGLAQVVTVVSMFFAGVSGSSSADVAAIGRVMLPPMKREGYNPANPAALVAAASTIANMIPPSIMAIVYGAVGGVSIAALFVIAYLQAPEAVAGLVQDIAGTNGTLIMVLIVVALVIAGDFLDAIPTIVISLPVIAVLVELGGIDPVHMGVVAIVTLAFGLITPPYGLSLLLATTFAEVPFSRGLAKSLPIYVVFFVVISLLIFFPALSLWLPGPMGVY
jgi:TRAP-type C4-dicarboxylate transport system permease large subunit